MLGKIAAFNEIIFFVEPFGPCVAFSHSQIDMSPGKQAVHAFNTAMQNDSPIPVILILWSYNDITDKLSL
ncbi:hypothetical protein D3C75_1030010 [compost metagenome]